MVVPQKPLTPAAFHVLVVLAEGPSHGYRVMQEAERITGGRLRLGPGTLYRTLQALMRDGLIHEVPGPEEDERRRSYTLTAVGRAQVVAEATRWSKVVHEAQRLGLVDAPGEPHRAPVTPVTPIPEDGAMIVPRLAVRDAAAAVAFYEEVFGGRELYRSADPGGAGLLHVELLIGDARLQLYDEGTPSNLNRAPPTLGGTPMILCIWMEDVERVFNQALQRGARTVAPVRPRLWGDRYGILEDPFGYHWGLASREEDAPPSDIKARARALFSRPPARGDSE